jgi:hypothetical protein
MHMIPARRHGDFIAGFIERAEEEPIYSQNNVHMTSGDTDA